ncbi:unnamed protein product, partial [Effrenium voratum]
PLNLFAWHQRMTSMRRQMAYAASWCWCPFATRWCSRCFAAPWRCRRRPSSRRRLSWTRAKFKGSVPLRCAPLEDRPRLRSSSRLERRSPSCMWRAS